MTGQGIAEQAGTSRQSIDDLLDTLLAPMGLAAEGGGSIVVADLLTLLLFQAST